MVEATFAVLETPPDLPQPGVSNNSPSQNATRGVVAPLACPPLAPLSSDATDTQNTPAPAVNQAKASDPASSQTPLAFAARLEELPRVEAPPSKAVGVPTAKPQFSAAATPAEPFEPDVVPSVTPAAPAKETDGPNRHIPFSGTPDRVGESKASQHSAPAAPDTGAVPILRAQPASTAVRATPSQGASQPALAARTSEVYEAPVSRPSVSRGLSLSLGEPGSDRVEIQIQERQGALQVAVRSGDPALNSSLRGELSNLVTRLESRGYATETWAPAEAVSAPARTPGNNFSESRQSGQDGHTGGGGGQSGEGGAGSERQGRDEHRPRWLEEWEFSTDSRKKANL
jgi:hypothetical protein